MRKIEVSLIDLIDICLTFYTGSFERDYIFMLLPENITVEEEQEFLDRYRHLPYTEEDIEELTANLERLRRWMEKYQSSRGKAK